MATLTQISQALNDLLPRLEPAGAVPTGCIAHFHTVPDGWLLCNGAAVSRTTYANLFAVIGTTYGTGDGVATFSLPNLAGRFLESITNAADVGRMKEAGLPNITGQHNGTPWIGSGLGAFFVPESHDRIPDGGSWAKSTVSFDASRSESIYGMSISVQPYAVMVLACIKS